MLNEIVKIIQNHLKYLHRNFRNIKKKNIQQNK